VTVCTQAAFGAGSARSGVDRGRSGFDHAAITGMELPGRIGPRQREHIPVLFVRSAGCCARARRRSCAGGRAERTSRPRASSGRVLRPGGRLENVQKVLTRGEGTVFWRPVPATNAYERGGS